MSETAHCAHAPDGPPCSVFCAAIARQQAEASSAAAAPPEKAAEAPAAEAPAASPAPPAISDELRAVLERADAYERDRATEALMARRSWAETMLGKK